MRNSLIAFALLISGVPTVSLANEIKFVTVIPTERGISVEREAESASHQDREGNRFTLFTNSIKGKEFVRFSTYSYQLKQAEWDENRPLIEFEVNHFDNGYMKLSDSELIELGAGVHELSKRANVPLRLAEDEDREITVIELR
ncbi:hypothetical protein [Vibrio panuliri]|uniref:DUF2057 domain-containing protein n=1 Tax=Vibrio panuliri TaxID=1381081 RepID=A0A1Q9HP91_9VIBR|nr:hypothetical protein [Vibrio panuliri]KAB1455112.1 hypothetical protein F7O85_19920 [Vibrio panuliri]OLQ92665.1 hypothetical protein BIY22_15185 [Vibrio panuliri]OLQ94840.1 hypothetical protein BIY20_00680 [Vibrio panuliri]